MRKTLDSARVATGSNAVAPRRKVLSATEAKPLKREVQSRGTECPVRGEVHAYHYGLYIGRFQIVTEAHVRNVETVLGKCAKAIVAIGSANQARDTRNPFTAGERVRMWEAALTPEQRARVIFVGQEDLGNPVRWASEVEKKVSEAIVADGLDSDRADIAVFGHRKDASSFYLDDFPSYVLEELPAIDGVSATKVRDAVFAFGSAFADAEHGPIPVDVDALAKRIVAGARDGRLRDWLDENVPAWCVDMLAEFMASRDYAALVIEYRRAKDYSKAWAPAPYPVNFTTADAIVVQGNRVLLVRRRGYPGKGLWALPGGHIKPEQTVLEAAMAELTEETGIDVSRTVLRNAYVDTFFMDNPWRSTRGRTITFASIFHLKPTPRGRTPEERRKSMALPFVRGMDDADRAAWKTFDEIRGMRSELFEDHAIIIDKALERLGVR